MSPVLVAETSGGDSPLGPALSIFDPVHIGIDEFGHPVRVPLIYRNMLIGGEPGSGKSEGANVKAVQRMLGHASAAMTLDVYADLFEDDLDQVADRLDRAATRAAADSMRTDGPGPVLDAVKPHRRHSA